MDPCETCLRWPECNGVDPDCPKRIAEETRCTHPDGIAIKPDGVHELSPCLVRDVELYTNCTVIVSRCKRCGAVDFRWMRTEETEQILLDEKENRPE